MRVEQIRNEYNRFTIIYEFASENHKIQTMADAYHIDQLDDLTDDTDLHLLPEFIVWLVNSDRRILDKDIPIDVPKELASIICEYISHHDIVDLSGRICKKGSLTMHLIMRQGGRCFDYGSFMI
jgi:hypothetical protein